MTYTARFTAHVVAHSLSIYKNMINRIGYHIFPSQKSESSDFGQYWTDTDTIGLAHP